MLSGSGADEAPAAGTRVRLGNVAQALQGDWVALASQLGVTEQEVIKIQSEFGSVTEQVLILIGSESCLLAP